MKPNTDPQDGIEDETTAKALRCRAESIEFANPERAQALRAKAKKIEEREAIPTADEMIEAGLTASIDKVRRERQEGGR